METGVTLVMVIYLAAAILPAVFLLRYIYKKDTIEKEPAGLLISLLVMGLCAAAVSIVLESLGENVLARVVSKDSPVYTLILAFVVVAAVEEGSKLFFLKLRTWRNPNFNYRFDGVVYAVFVSLGFALWENIGYVAMYGFSTAMVRAVTAVPGHACFGVFMGVWYGAARRYEYAGLYRRSRTCRWMALLLPALLHGAYDTIASSEGSDYGWVFVVFVLLMFAAAYIAVKKAAAHDRAF